MGAGFLKWLKRATVAEQAEFFRSLAAAGCTKFQSGDVVVEFGPKPQTIPVSVPPDFEVKAMAAVDSSRVLLDDLKRKRKALDEIPGGDDYAPKPDPTDAERKEFESTLFHSSG